MEAHYILTRKEAILIGMLEGKRREGIGQGRGGREGGDSGGERTEDREEEGEKGMNTSEGHLMKDRRRRAI